MAEFATLFRDLLPQPVADEFDNLYTRLQGFLNVSFNEDGTLINPPATQSLPLGAITPYAASSITDPNYLLCDGRAVSRVAYSDLFSLIGASYGVGDGATTFNIPDLRGKFPLGVATSGTGSSLAGTGGAIDHTHSIGGQSFSGTTGAAGAHSHTISSDGAHSHGGATGNAGSHDHGGATGSESSHTHQFTAVHGATAGLDFTAAQIGSPAPDTQGGTSHSHSITSVGDHSHSISSDGSHSHGGATGSVGDHTHTFSGTTSAGTSGAGNPPFIALNYIIRAKI